jgi:hypothetical protein
MNRLTLLFVLTLAGCDTAVKIDPDGYRCDVGNVCPTNYSCQSGICRKGMTVDPSCANVTCNAPPASTCTNGTTAHTFVGRCVAGQCQYDGIDTTCATTCSGGTCADACAGIPCVTPPQPACTNGNTLSTFAQTGTCAMGTCDYAKTDTACPNGCAQGRCSGVNLCQMNNVMCNMPPAATCVGSVRRTYGNNGTCDPGTGTCTYTSNDTNCPNGCALGQCLTASLTFTQTGPRVRFAVNALDIAPGSSGNSALAVGNGKIARWDGSTWTELAAPSATTKLNAVAFVSANLAYAVGANRTAITIRPTNNQVLAVTLPGSAGANLVAVSGRGEAEVLLADDLGEWWRFRNTMWTNGTLPNSSGPYTISGAYLDESLRERIVGGCGMGSTAARCVGYRFVSGGTPMWTIHQQTGTPGFTAVGGGFDIPTTASASDAYVGRSDTTLVDHSNTGVFLPLTTTPILDGNGIEGVTAQAASVSRDVFTLTSSVGSSTGHLYRLTRSMASTTATDALQTFYGEEHLSPNEANGVLVAEVRRGSAINNIFRRGTLTNEALDVGEDFLGASVDSAGALVFAGMFSDIAVRSPAASTFDFRRAPTTWTLHGVEGRNGTGTLFVGEDANTNKGVVVRMVGNNFTTLANQSNVVFNGACRVSDTEGWAVGTNGTIFRVTGVGATAATSPTTEDLLAVDCVAGVAVACGANGTALRFANNTWTVVTPAAGMAGQNLKTCKLTSQGAVVGGDGFFYGYAPATGWTTLAGQAGLVSLVVRGPQEIYGAFTNGTTSDVRRFDGATWSPSLLNVTGVLGGGVQAGARVVWGGTLGVIVEGR